MVQTGALTGTKRTGRHVFHSLERDQEVNLAARRFLLNLIAVALILLKDWQHIFSSPGMSIGDVNKMTRFDGLELDRHGIPRFDWCVQACSWLDATIHQNVSDFTDFMQNI